MFDSHLQALASALVVSDSANKDDLKAIKEHLRQLANLCEKDPNWKKAHREASKRVNALIRKPKAEADLSQVEKLIDLLSEETTKSEISSILSDDTHLLGEFVSDLKLRLDDIEQLILNLDSSSESSSELLGILHSLKGEAGMLSLNELIAIVHQMEDTVQHSTHYNIDTLSRAKDWIGDALESYLSGNAPELPRAIIDQLIEDKNSSAPSQHVERDEEDLLLIGEFLHESTEGLALVDQYLLDGEMEGLDAEKVNGIFRVFHTIKGVSGFLELAQITELSHTTETMLDQLRDGSAQVCQNIFDLVFESTKLLRTLFEIVEKATNESIAIESISGIQEHINAIKEHIDRVDRNEKENCDKENSTLEKASTAQEKSTTAKVEEQKASVLEEALDPSPTSTEPQTKTPISQISAEKKVTSKPNIQAKPTPLPEKKTSATPKKPTVTETVKVELGRVDSLVENIGELVIVESMVAHAPEIAALMSSPRMRNYFGQLSKITRQLQEIGIRMRMVPLRAVFQKMSRMVRDLARKSNKEIYVKVTGAQTEMDRNMVEQISDPLVHLIRNSVDHGIEFSQDRISNGKAKAGTITLNAQYEGSSVVIEIRDDGRGLDREKIVKKAIERGLIRKSDQLSDMEAFNLIFAPGFSTAQQVTEISGRGVGMDVVKRNIEGMRGRIEVHSKKGEYTSIRLVLPLTLAIIDGTLISCGEERYIIPTLSIIESLRPTASMLAKIAGKKEVINFRGQLYPIVRLSKLLDIKDAQESLEDALVVIVESRNRRIGIMVDDVLTQQQVVIKSIGSALKNIELFSGAAIMSTGRVGLIVDTDEVISKSNILNDINNEQHF